MASVVLVAGCGITAPTSQTSAKLNDVHLRQHIMPMSTSAPKNYSVLQNAAQNSKPHLTYYGGPVISNVKVFTVFWTNNIANQSQLNDFYTTVTNSPYFDWLNEYNTPFQSIGRGRFIGSYVDVNAPTPSKLEDTEIQLELTRLIMNGSIPAPDGNTMYMNYFPPGVTVDLDGQAQSCVQFCAYHMSFNLNGQEVIYGVIPDTSGFLCTLGCGGDFSNKMNNVTSTSSHELIEAVTDAYVGEATGSTPAYPLAWYDADTGGPGGGQWGEIGDICVGQKDTVNGVTVQKEWSNKYNSCIATAPSCTPQCTGKTCGDDGCGGICGLCGQGQYCVNGQCSNTCTPQCNGKACGDDGCGGQCGICPNSGTCTNGTCYPANCVPNCNYIICNTDDGCGGKCGCVGSQTCFFAICL